MTITSACRAVRGRVLALYAACRPEVLRLHSSFTLHRASFGADACTASVAYSGWYFATLDRERTGPAQRGRVLESVCQVLHAAASQCRAGLCTAHSEPVDKVSQEMRPFRAEGTWSGRTLGGGVRLSPALSACLGAFSDYFLHECPACPFNHLNHTFEQLRMTFIPQPFGL